MKITIDFDSILDRVYSESAWHAAYAPGVALLTPDNARMLEMRIEDGFTHLRSRLSGYLDSWNFNRFLEKGNITIELVLAPAMDSMEATLRDIIVQALASYALKSFYGEETSCYGTSWRMYCARLMILLAREA